MADDDLDLFGDPVRLPNGRRGRPAHRPSMEIENKIKLLLALGWTNQRIANACHVSLPTLRKHYFSVLKARDVQRDRLDAHRFTSCFKAAAAGNVGAMRLLDQMIQKNDAMQAAAQLRDDTTEAKAEKLGAKEQARRAAAEAIATGGETWGDDLKPDGGLH